MAAPTKTARMRGPLMSAFRDAHETRDAKKRVDERDEGGERVIAGRRATGRSTISEAELQRTVAQDLDSLMNTINLDSAFDLSSFPEARRSIVNYGIPDIVHRTIDEYGVNYICAEIAEALSVYEPRLVPGSIRVFRDPRVEAVELKVRFIVRGELDCDPLNLPVEFVADVESNSGKITVGRA